MHRQYDSTSCTSISAQFPFFLCLLDEKMRKTRSKQGGSRKVRFTEGWVEFKDKRIAKRVAAALNNTQIGTLCFLCVFFLHQVHLIHSSRKQRKHTTYIAPYIKMGYFNYFRYNSELHAQKQSLGNNQEN